MKQYTYGLSALFLFLFSAAGAQTTRVAHFEKIIVSPHIQVTFVEGAEESVSVATCTVDRSKLHIDVNDGVLRVYLDGAKDIEKNKKTYRNGSLESESLYKGTVVTATISYKTLHELSIRGEETQHCKSTISGKAFELSIYGESKVTFDRVQLDQFQASIYGEGSLEFLAGSVKSQKYTAYGEGTVNSLGIKGETARLMAYGEAGFKMNVSDEISIRAIGEARLEYKGNPTINKGLHIGELHVSRLN